jgi:rRNA processing protein Gar1
MKRKVLGYISHKSKNSGNLILRTENQPKLNAIVYNKRGQKIGRVFDIFGPKKWPFVSIKINKDHKMAKGKPVYINEDLKKKRKKKNK